MPFHRRALVALVFVVPLAGCTVINGAALEEAGVDRSISTASIAPAADPVQEAETLSDSRTVRNAVSAANVDRVASEPLAWSNAETGASGTITAIDERRAGDEICRSFTTSRQRFDGVRLYGGEACTRGQGEWTLTRFCEGG